MNFIENNSLSRVNYYNKLQKITNIEKDEMMNKNWRSAKTIENKFKTQKNNTSQKNNNLVINSDLKKIDIDEYDYNCYWNEIIKIINIF